MKYSDLMIGIRPGYDPLSDISFHKVLDHFRRQGNVVEAVIVFVTRQPVRGCDLLMILMHFRAAGHTAVETEQKR